MVLPAIEERSSASSTGVICRKRAKGFQKPCATGFGGAIICTTTETGMYWLGE